MPPSAAPASLTFLIIVRAPASKTVTPSPSLRKYTLQRAGWPVTTWTPGATSFGARELMRAVVPEICDRRGDANHEPARAPRRRSRRRRSGPPDHRMDDLERDLRSG